MKPNGQEIEKRRQFDAFYRETYLEMLQYVGRHVKDQNDVEDLVSKVFMIAWQKYDDFKDYDNLRGWLYTTARYVIGNYIQARRVREEWIQLIEDPDALYSADVTELETVDLSIYRPETVGPEDFRMFVLLAVDKQSAADIAAEFGISVAALYKRVERTRKRLKASFEENLTHVSNSKVPNKRGK